jgi:hypothetical protein
VNHTLRLSIMERLALVEARLRYLCSELEKLAGEVRDVRDDLSRER